MPRNKFFNFISINRLSIFSILGTTVLILLSMLAYLVGLNQGTRLGLNENTALANTFNAVVNDKTFSFAAVGDFSDGDDFIANLRTIQKQKTDFSLALGDFNYTYDITEEEWCSRVKGVLGESYPFQIVAGNHELPSLGRDLTMAKYTACLPNKMDGMVGDYGDQYYFDVDKTARFIILSPDLEINGSERSYFRDGDGYLWTQDVIEEAKKEGIEWIIVAMHKNCISAGKKICEIGTDILSLLVEKKVDLILQGHDHTYQRSKVLNVNANCPEITITYSESCVVPEAGNTTIKGRGTTLLINGTGGRNLYDIKPERPDAAYFAFTSGKNKLPSYGPLIIEIDNNKLTSNYMNNSEQVLDTFTIFK